MSTIEVNTIKPISGSSTVTLGESGDTIALASGASQTLAVNNPAFSVGRNTTGNTLTTNTFTLVAFNNKSFDTDNAYDTSTYKFTVPSGKAGKYFFVSTVAMNAAFAYVQLNIYKNGAAVKRGTAIRNDASSVTVAGALDLAVGDYIQIYCRQDATTNNTESSPIYSYFDGYKLIGA
jgi:hypothetical protein